MTQETKTNHSDDVKRPFWIGILRKLLIVGILAVLGLFVMSLMAAKPENLGLTNGRLAECPDKPNCVSTMTDSASHRMEPIVLDGKSKPALNQAIKKVVRENFSRAKIVEENENYLRFEFTSMIFRFVDDVEFFIDDRDVIQFRSASRVGHSDLGANRKRMLKIVEGLKNE